MHLTYPWFLWALLSVLIPIIIHLYHFRRYKTVYFTNVKFLKEVKEQTSARTRLKHLLALFFRILTLIALVLAFCMPYIPAKDAASGNGHHDVSIYIDNSFSMSAESEDVQLLQKAKSRAQEIIEAFSNEDKIQVLTSDFEGKDQRLLSKELALDRINEIVISHKVKNLDKVINRQKQCLRKGLHKNKEIFILSDFQKNISSNNLKQDSLFKVNLVYISSVQNQNVSIDTAWFINPVQSIHQSNKMIVKLQNHSKVEVPNVRLSLKSSEQTRPYGTLTLPPLTTIYDTIDVPVLKTGWHSMNLSITDYPIEFDNDYYFSFYVKEQLNILEIYQQSIDPYISAAFDNDEYFELEQQSSKQLDFSGFSNKDLIIVNGLDILTSGLNGELYNYVQSGGNLLIFPSKAIDLESYNKLFATFNSNQIRSMNLQEQSVSFVNFNEFIFNDVFIEKRSNLKLPSAKNYYSFKKSSLTGEEQLLRFRNGESFLSKYIIDKGRFYVCASALDLEHSDLFQNGEIFVPMLYRMALSSNKNQKIAYFIGVDERISVEQQANTSDLIFKIGGSSIEFIPEQRNYGSAVLLKVNNQLQNSGHYYVFQEAQEIISSLSFNYDRKESNMDFYSFSDLKDKFDSEYIYVMEGAKSQQFIEEFNSNRIGTALWKLFLILSLIFLAAETAVLRLWKT